jgi:putative membrane protein
MGILIRLGISALALFGATLLIPGINLGGDSALTKLGTLLAVAAIFGIVNAVLRPIIKILGCWAYVLTLGIVALVVNGALFQLTSFIAGRLDLPFHVEHFWPSAVLGALFVAVASWLLNLLVPDGDDTD